MEQNFDFLLTRIPQYIIYKDKLYCLSMRYIKDYDWDSGEWWVEYLDEDDKILQVCVGDEGLGSAVKKQLIVALYKIYNWCKDFKFID